MLKRAEKVKVMKYKRMKEPLVSIVMSVYNENEKYLKASADSILNQSYQNLEIILIDDGSCPKCSRQLEQYRRKDKRVVLIKNEKNLGLTKSLNIGIRYSHGKYIARMDSDDISFQNRISEQVNYMEKHSQTAVIGAEVCDLRTGKKMPGMYFSNDRKVMEARLLFCNAGIIHSTAVIRKSFLKEKKIFYQEDYVKAQDYGLWSDVIYSGGRMKLLHRVLAGYRIHPGQITQRFHSQQDLIADRIRKDNFYRCMGSVLTMEEMKIYDGLVKMEMCGALRENIAVIEKIKRKNTRLDARTLNQELLLRWWLRGRHMQLLGQKIDKRYYLNRYALQILWPGNFVYAFKYLVLRK